MEFSIKPWDMLACKQTEELNHQQTDQLLVLTRSAEHHIKLKMPKPFTQKRKTQYV